MKQEEKLTHFIAIRTGETIHKTYKDMPWPQRKKFRKKLRSFLEKELTPA